MNEKHEDAIRWVCPNCEAYNNTEVTDEFCCGQCGEVYEANVLMTDKYRRLLAAHDAKLALIYDQAAAEFLPLPAWFLEYLESFSQADTWSALGFLARLFETEAALIHDLATLMLSDVATGIMVRVWLVPYVFKYMMENVAVDLRTKQIGFFIWGTAEQLYDDLTSDWHKPAIEFEIICLPIKLKIGERYYLTDRGYPIRPLQRLTPLSEDHVPVELGKIRVKAKRFSLREELPGPGCDIVSRILNLKTHIQIAIEDGTAQEIIEE